VADDWLTVRTFSAIEDRWYNTVRNYLPPPGWFPDEAGIGLMTAALGAHWGRILAGWLPSQATFYEWQWDFFSAGEPISVRQVSTVGSADGTGDDRVLPPQVAGLVILRTGAGAPTRTRGLQYMPLVQARYAGPDGTLSAEGRTALQRAADSIASVVVDDQDRSWRPATVRRVTSLVTVIERGEAHPLLATQRRRSGFWKQEPF
jgi:hypothetical protein